MRVLVTGGNGQLGIALGEALKGHELLLTDVDTMDITNSEAVEKAFREFQPEFLVHGAAFTNVDGAEESPDVALLVNGKGTEILASACKKHGVPMIYVSTDYVFDGTSQEPYKPDAATNPQSVYGQTKLAGEEATKMVPEHWILRTSWVYGEGKNFVRTMLALAKTHEQLTVVGDQWGRPTAASDLAIAIRDVIEKHPEPGIYHVQNDGAPINWAQFATKIFEISEARTTVLAISSEEYLAGKQGKKVAPRPSYSVLDLTKTKEAGIHLADWETSLRDYLAREGA